MVQQAATVERGRLPVRDLRSGREGNGLAGEGVRLGQVAGLDGEAESVARSSISSASSGLWLNASVSAVSASGSALSSSRSRLRASSNGPTSRYPIRLACGTAAAR